MASSKVLKSPVVRLGGLIIGLIVWYAAIYSPLVHKVQELKEEVEMQETRILGLEKRIKRARGASGRIKQAEAAEKALIARAVKGATVQEVASSLQNMILKEADAVGATVTLYRTGRPRKFRDHQVAAVTFSMNCSSSQLLHLLESLEKKGKIMRFKNLTISTMRGDPPRLRVNMEIEALFLGQEAS